MRGINKEFLKRNPTLRMRTEGALAASFAQVLPYDRIGRFFGNFGVGHYSSRSALIRCGTTLTFNRIKSSWVGLPFLTL